jgi:ATP-dependent exoDNAse (exonuclease V) beta subunit
MFPYQELATEYCSVGRFYILPDGTSLPSITTVLSNTEPPEKAAALQAWKDRLGPEEAARQSKEATDHGTALHWLVERHLGGTPAEQLEPTERDLGAFNSLKPKLAKVEPWGLEKVLYSTKLRIAGRTDCIGLYKGVPSILDWKTSKRIKHDIDSYKLQLCFYAHAHNELYGTDIQQGVILMASDGFPQEWVIDLSQYLPDLLNRTDQFWAHLDALLSE